MECLFMISCSILMAGQLFSPVQKKFRRSVHNYFKKSLKSANKGERARRDEGFFFLLFLLRRRVKILRKNRRHGKNYMKI